MMGDLEKVIDAFDEFKGIAEGQGCRFSSYAVFVHTHRCWVEKLAAQRKLHIEILKHGVDVQIGPLTVYGS